MGARLRENNDDDVGVKDVGLLPTKMGWGVVVQMRGELSTAMDC